ncbi:MAG TPA: TetR/AcrR family transcriptional regulator [Terriglobia bacterium]|nr:TetR/AcrR family transcriptional regulator [Terriglobia bacterium]
MEKSAKRQDIIKAAIEVFAKNGFRGTTTRDLAAHAEVNEAIIFRHFNTKQELYRAILEQKVSQGMDSRWEEARQLAESGDDQKFLELFGHQFLARHEEDSTFMRLLIFSALEGHELSEMFLRSLAGRDPLGAYMQRRMDAGAFRKMDPHLAARAFLGMFVAYIQMQEIFGQKNVKTFDRNEVVQTFVSIFLTGMKS